MSAPPGHDHVSERQVGKWEDCVWMAFVEWVRQVHDRAIPATHAEGDALRAASGDVGFSNLGDANKASIARYRYDPPPALAATFTALWAALKPGTMALVSGWLGAWSKGSRWRRWDPESTAVHAVTVYRFGPSDDDLWWCDPLAPEVMGSGKRYLGERIPKAELKRFVDGGGIGHFVAPVLPVGTPATYTQAQLDAAKGEAAKAGYNQGRQAVINAATAVAPK